MSYNSNSKDNVNNVDNVYSSQILLPQKKSYTPTIILVLILTLLPIIAYLCYTAVYKSDNLSMRCCGRRS